jgi:hypothetical protein
MATAVVLNAADGNPAQPRAAADDKDFDFVKSVGETGYREEAQEESFEDASDSTLGQETETLLVEMRKAITEQGLTGSEYKAPDLLRFLRARSNNVTKASKLFVDHQVRILLLQLETGATRCIMLGTDIGCNFDHLLDIFQQSLNISVSTLQQRNMDLMPMANDMTIQHLCYLSI